MKTFWHRLRIVFFFAFLIPLVGKAQREVFAKQKALLIYEIAQRLEWPNENKLDAFEIAVLDENCPLLPTLDSLMADGKVKDKFIDVAIYTSVKTIDSPQILILGSEHNSEIKSITHLLKGKPVLYVTDELPDKLSLMLNFFSKNNKLKFEFNKNRFESCKIAKSERLESLGGKPLKSVSMQDAIEQSIKERDGEIQKLRKENDKLARELLDHKKRIGQFRISMADQTHEIHEQRSELSHQEDSIDNQSIQLSRLGLKIKAKETELEEKLNALRENEAYINRQKRKVDEYNLILDKQRKEIEEQSERIEEQKNVLDTKEKKLETQKGIMTMGGVVLLLIVGLLFVIWRSNRQRKLANAVLAEKNFGIIKRNAEIEKQKQMLQHQNEQITSSLKYATTIQQAMLPREYELEAFEHFILYRPKDIVSGDFYWMRSIEEHGQLHYLIAAVDCTGHGVPGAFMSMIANRLLNEIVNVSHVHSPGSILAKLDEGVQYALKQHLNGNRDGMDVCLVKISDLDADDKRELVFSGAKRPLYLHQKGKLRRVKGSRRGIAGMTGIARSKSEDFEEQSFELSQGDTLYLLTDGYIDQNNLERKRFGSKRFMELIESIANSSMHAQLRVLEHELDQYQKDTEQRDDITVLGIRS